TPTATISWWKQGHLLKLNFIIFSLISTIYWLSNRVSNRWGQKPGIYLSYLFIILGSHNSLSELLQASLEIQLPSLSIKSPIQLIKLSQTPYIYTLVSKDRPDKALQVLAVHYAAGNAHDPLVTSQIVKIESALTTEKAAIASASYLDMIRTKGNRHQLYISVTLGIITQWAGNGVVSYYLPLVLESVGGECRGDALLFPASDRTSLSSLSSCRLSSCWECCG
ncbi:unnamed protein product, partial [Clonostachys chloroleuca]